MSSKNRKKQSELGDVYLTPPALVHAGYTMLAGRRGDQLYRVKRVLEPGCGPAPFARLSHVYCRNMVQRPVGVERFRYSMTGIAKGVRRVYSDFLLWSTRTRFDFVPGNPPFTYAERFIRKSHTLLAEPTSMIFFLMRLSVLGANCRVDLWNEINLLNVDVIRPRPSFDEKGNDSAEYAFFTMDGREPGSDGPPQVGWVDW